MTKSNPFSHLNKITSEQDYWKQHKEYKIKIKKLTKNFKLYFKNPADFISQFEILLKEMVYIGIINQQQSDEHLKKVLEGMNAYPEMKEKLHSQLEKLKNKIIKKKLKQEKKQEKKQENKQQSKQ